VKQLIDVDDIVVESRGDVSAAERGYSREKLARLIERSRVPVQSARVMLVLDSSRQAHHATADAELDVGKRTVHATSEGDTIFGAVHELERALEVTFRALTLPCGAASTGGVPGVDAPR
jgi:ribosome-associated translation inhibitor RaiA